MIVPAIDKNKILRAAIDVNASGANIVIHGVVGLVTKILGLLLIANADVNVSFKEDISGHHMSGPLPMGLKGNGFVLPTSEIAYMVSSENNGLDIDLSAGVQVSGFVVYIQE